MKYVPPTIVRRLVIAPLVVVVEAVLVVASPVLLVLAVLASPFFGGWRPVRALWIVLGFTTRHMAVVLASFGLWIASGFGLRLRGETMVRAHYALVRWFVAGNYDTMVRVARVRVEVAETADASAALDDTTRPILVFGRHAGEGDTLLVVYELLVKHDRGPRVVMHEGLKLDPMIDVLGSRLPNRFVDPRGGDTEVEIAAMAAELDPRAALIIFPEGTNFSPQARQRAIERLERAGLDEEAQWAREMKHLSAPRPGGALAAIAAAPDADILFLAHAGFPVGMAEVWSLLPAQQRVEVQVWHEPRGALPAGRDEQIDWLFAWWRRMDDWISEREAERS